MSQFKVVFASDFHGTFVCKQSLGCFLNVLKSDNNLDEVVLNGDIVDLPMLSRHTKKLFLKGLMKGYSEAKEIEYTKTDILAPIAKAAHGKVIFRLGNHDERITSPFHLGESQLARLATLYGEYGTTELSEMLELEKFGMIYDDTPVRNYFNVFSCVHGLSISKDAGRKNIQEYMGSGVSGHSHRCSTSYITNRHSSYVWAESGCMRVKEEVEYLPTAKIADWANGFTVVTFDLSSKKQPLFFIENHAIINGKTAYNGKIISC